jgi:ABC-type dipeptide/oligopeptide/nickel transport system permease component
MGRLIVDATLLHDFITVQGCSLMIAAVILLANLIVDITYGWLDPRIRYD